MLTKNTYLFATIISFLLIVESVFHCNAVNASYVFLKANEYQRDTVIIANKSKINNPKDSITLIKLRKNKLLSKEGIVIKQSANKTSNSPDSLNVVKEKFVKTAQSFEKNKINLSKTIYIPFKNNNLTEDAPIPLFKQLSDKNSLSKIEFLNTVKQLNQLKKEIIKKNSEQKKTNPIHWLLLLIAAILIIIVLAFFIKETLTLVLIAFMLVALVLLLGFL